MKIWLLAFLFIFPTRLLAKDPIYLITDVEGQVSVIPKGSKRASRAIKKIPLKSGDRVITGNRSRVEISSNEGTVLELKEKTNLEVQSLSKTFRSFYLSAGKLWGRFKAKVKKRKRAYRINMPTSVASVRGTDLALAVEENGDSQAGVIEGVVEMSPSEDASDEVKQAWGEKPVVLEDFQGVIAKKDAIPIETKDLPPLVVDSLDWFDHVRDRVPELRDVFKNLDLRASETLRENALRDSIDWSPPSKLDIPRP